MTQRHQQQAERIVAAFKESLDDDVRQQISNSQFNSLGLMVQKALGNEMAVAIERMDELLRQMRSETEKAELGI